MAEQSIIEQPSGRPPSSRIIDGAATRGPTGNLRRYKSVVPYVLLIGVVAVALIAALSTWSFVAPLASGAMAPGVISVESVRKTIQHLEGGIIQEIHVSDGDRVTAGDPLVTLTGTADRAEAEALDSRLVRALALEARLVAQRDDAESVDFPSMLIERQNEPLVSETITAQQYAFEQQRETLEGRRSIEQERIEQAEQQIAGLEAQITALIEQLRLIDLEIADVQSMVDLGLARRPRLLSLQRAAAQLQGQIDANRASIAEIEQRIAESRLRVIDLENTYRDDAIERLEQVRERIAETTQQIRASDDVVQRLVVRSPTSGIVVGQQVHTIGGVVRSGDPLMDLVPVDDDLIINARVNPQNVDVVRPGVEAQVVLTALNRRVTPRLTGVVEDISADRLEDDRSGEAYYEARVRIDRTELGDIDRDELVPGMPVEVIFVTGERSVVEYLLEPLLETARRGMVAE
jgi:HlyD family type I secretion membrane fusion protein